MDRDLPIFAYWECFHDQKPLSAATASGLGTAIVEPCWPVSLPVLGLARSACCTRRAQPMRPGPGRPAAALTACLAGPHPCHDWLADASAVWLVNNQRRPGACPSPHWANKTHWAIVQAINLTSPPRYCSAMPCWARQPAMVERRLLHVSSGAARHAYPGWRCIAPARPRWTTTPRPWPPVSVTPACAWSAPGVGHRDGRHPRRQPGAVSLRERFDALKANGQLTSPQTCAEHLVAVAHPGI